MCIYYYNNFDTEGSEGLVFIYLNIAHRVVPACSDIDNSADKLFCGKKHGDKIGNIKMLREAKFKKYLDINTYTEELLSKLESSAIYTYNINNI